MSNPTVKAKTKSKINQNVILIAITAMFAAIVTVTTMFIKIPGPTGYTHAGDSMVYLAASALPGPFGFIAAAIGGALADLLSGYADWALPTAIIKALNVLPFFLAKLAFKNVKRADKFINIPNLVMILPTSIITVGCYFAAKIFLRGFESALAAVIPNIFQAAVAAVLYVVIGLGLDAVSFKKRIIPDLYR